VIETHNVIQTYSVIFSTPKVVGCIVGKKNIFMEVNTSCNVCVMSYRHPQSFRF